jgi:hypothetical protein
MIPTEIVLTNNHVFILILCGIGGLTLVDFVLFYIYKKIYEMYPKSEEESYIGARIRTLHRKLVK